MTALTLWTFRAGLGIGMWLVAMVGFIALWFILRKMRWQAQLIEIQKERIDALKFRHDHRHFDLEPIDAGYTNVICTTCRTSIGTISAPVFFGELAERHYREKVKMNDDEEIPADCETPANE